MIIGVAQEMVPGFRVFQKGKRKLPRQPRNGPPCFSFYRGHVSVNQYYFYLLDRDFGLCFIKFSSFAPFGVRVWVNGHEWAKRRLAARQLRYPELDNGFFSCNDPEGLQKICDRSVPNTSTRSSASGSAGCRILSPPATATPATTISSLSFNSR